MLGAVMKCLGKCTENVAKLHMIQANRLLLHLLRTLYSSEYKQFVVIKEDRSNHTGKSSPVQTVC